MTTAHGQVPGFLGRVLTRDGGPEGTCFQVAPAVFVTASHVLRSLGADEVGASVSLDHLALGGGPPAQSTVVRLDPALDLAVLRADHSFEESVPGMAATDSVLMTEQVAVTGASHVEDPAHEYRYLDTTGSWAGGTLRNGVAIGRLEAKAVVPGMSGAPVRRLTDNVVVGVVSARYNSDTGWMRDSVWVARTEHLAPLLKGIADITVAARAPARVSGYVPRLPRNFVPRSEDVATLVDTLLSMSGEPVVVHGMPGIGKTVLAAAVARDQRVRESFPDGVLWVTLGRERDITHSQADLAGELGDGDRAFAEPEQGTARLRTLLAARSCLLVVDDVWSQEDLGAFDVLGPHGRMMVTTRDARAGVSLDAVKYPVSALPEDLALDLLMKWAGQDADQERAREIVRACGRLPLALSMIGAMVRGRHDGWNNALNKLRAADLASIHQYFPGYRHESLLKALQVSVDALPNAGVVSRYLDFALFTEDVAVPEAVLVTLWTADGLRPDLAQDDINLLVERSLVQRDDADRRLSLHDLLFDYVRAVRSETGDAQARHRRLVAAYRAKCPQDWPSGPDDGYFFEHLSRHLVEAGQADELHRLISLTAADGHNAWYETKRDRGDVAGFLSDVTTAWQLAESACDSDDTGRTAESIALQIRYALITASLNSLARNNPPELLAAALAQDVRGAREVLTYAARVPDPAQRCAALAALAPHLPDELIHEALAAAEATAESDAEEDVRATAIGRLAARLTEFGHAEEGRAAVERLKNPALRATALAITAAHRPEATTEAIQSAAQLKAGRSRAQAQARVAKVLADCGLSDRAVDAAKQIGGTEARWSALGRIAPHLPQSLREAAMTHAFETGRPAKRIRALLPFLPWMTDSQLRQVLDGVTGLGNGAEIGAAYAVIAGYLSEPLTNKTLERALKMVLKAKASPRRGEAMATVAAHLPAPLARTALVRVKRQRAYQAEALAALGARLAELGHQDEALDLARSTADGDTRAQILGAIAPHLSAAEVTQALTLTGVIGDAAAQSHAVSRLIPHLATTDRVEVADEVAQDATATDRVSMMLEIARSLPATDRSRLLDDALQTAKRIQDAEERASALARFAPDRPAEVLAAIAKDRGHSMRPWYTTLLGALADAGWTDEAVAVVRTIRPLDRGWDSFEPWQSVYDDAAYDVPEWLLDSRRTRLEFAHAEREMEKQSVTLLKAALLGHLLAYLSDDVRADVAREALACLDTDWSGSFWSSDSGDLEDMAFAAIARNLPPDLTDQAAGLLTTRSELRGIPFPETAITLALREHGATRHPDVDHALVALLVMRHGDADGQMADDLVAASWSYPVKDPTVVLQRTAENLTVALPRIVRGLPLYAIERLLARTAEARTATESVAGEWVWPTTGSAAEQAVLSALAIRLAELGETARAVKLACALWEPKYRRQAVEELAALLPRDALFSVWTGRPGTWLIRELSKQARDDLLSDLAGLTSVIVALGGEGVATAELAAIREVSHWWP
ncbi:NB-ARC domain-containing protein [Streptomyces sp. NPDC005820]|uniref:NB-ARC domain-containing protein n=1 Tax=Streptomyces sp. NPDC005820 TaxID=3157069 RepID=UPI0033F22101